MAVQKRAKPVVENAPAHENGVVVAFDTNMLLNIERFNVDIFRQAKEIFGKVEFVVPQEVLAELEMLSKRSKKLAREAKIAGIAMEKNGAKVVDFREKHADLALLKLAPLAVIGTNDKELKISVRKSNGRVLILRQRKFLEI